MSILRSIFRAFTGDPGNPCELDWLPMTEQKLPPTPSVAKPRAVPTEPPDWDQPSHALKHINQRAAEANGARSVPRLTSVRRKP